MKWPSWMRGLVLLRSMVRALDRIEAQLRRIADAHEGISPKGREVEEEKPGPIVFQEPAASRAADFTLIEKVEAGLARHLGRPPTAEEVVHELDGIEWTSEDLKPADRERLGL